MNSQQEGICPFLRLKIVNATFGIQITSFQVLISFVLSLRVCFDDANQPLAAAISVAEL
jgi:hypothetical protein